MVYTVLMILHVIISIILILVILTQSSKGAGLDSSLGGTASNMLGGQAAPKFLQNLTVIFGILFVFSSIMLVKHVSSPSGSSVAPSKTKSKALKEFQKKIAEKETSKEVAPSEAPTEKTALPKDSL